MQYIILILLLGIYVLSPNFAPAQWSSQRTYQPFNFSPNLLKTNSYTSLSNSIAPIISPVFNPLFNLKTNDTEESYEPNDIIELEQQDGSVITMSYQDMADEFEEFIQEKIDLGLADVEEIVEDGEVIRVVRYAYDPDSADRLALQLENFIEEMELIREEESEMNLSNIEKLNFQEYIKYLHKNVLPLFKSEEELPKETNLSGNTISPILNTPAPLFGIQKTNTSSFGSLNINSVNLPQLPAFGRGIGTVSASHQVYPFSSGINSNNVGNTYYSQPVYNVSREENIAENTSKIQSTQSIRDVLGIEFNSNNETLWDDSIPYNPCEEECDDGVYYKDLYHNEWGDDKINLSVYIYGGLQLMPKYRTIEGIFNTDLEFFGISMSPLHASAYFESSDIPNVNIELESFDNTIYSETSTGLSHELRKGIEKSPEPIVIPVTPFFSVNLSATLGGQVGIELGYDVTSEIIEGVIEPYINAYGNLAASVDFIVAEIGVSGTLTFIEDRLPIVASIEKKETNPFEDPLWCSDRDLIECAFSIRNSLEALNGEFELYLKICNPLLPFICPEYYITLFDWDGIYNEWYLINITDSYRICKPTGKPPYCNSDVIPVTNPNH